MSTMGRSLVIVGGGVAGLCAGVYARKCGYEPTVLEMSASAGGLATSWKRGEYTFETCLHWLTGCNPERPLYSRWQEVFDIGRLAFVHPPEFARLETEQGQSLRIYTDPVRLREELMSKSSADARQIRRWTRAIERFAGFPMPDFTLDAWARIRAELRVLPYVPALWRWSQTTGEAYARRFRHPLLRSLFGEGDMRQLSAIALMFALAWMSARDAAYVIGGSRAITGLLEENLHRLGGRLRCNARVERILLEGGRAVGVRLTGGEIIPADWVVSAADGHSTLYELLEGRYVDDASRVRYEEGRIFPSYVQVSLGIARDLSHQPALLTRILDRPLQVDPLTTLSQVSFRFFHFDPTFAPRGKTAVTCFLPTRHDRFWTELQRSSPQAYQDEKSRVRQAVLEILERIVPGASAAVEIADVSTPATVIRFTGNWHGSMEGWLLAPGQGFRLMPNTLPGLERFVMAGQWVLPGGGLPSGLLTARAAIKAICERDGTPFRPRAS
jgi:phytoene dehydrogenase-like protein